MTSQSRTSSAVSNKRSTVLQKCGKCKGLSDARPCEEYVEELRNEFTIQIDTLFRNKMKEFINFIEEVLDVEDQIDPE